MTDNIWKIYGNVDPTILIAGHSHVFPMYMAVQRRIAYQETFGVASQTDFSVPVEIGLSYWEFVARNAKKRTVAIAWNGNQHNFHFLIESHEPFKIFGVYEDIVEAPVVTLRRLEELFRPTFQELKNVLKMFASTTQLVLLGTPPPKSKKFIDSRIRQDPFFLQMASNLGILIDDLQSSSDPLRISMWNFTQMETKKIAEDFGISFIPTPDSAIDSSGLLLNTYWTEDLSHANEDFGALMLDELTKFETSKK